MEKCLCTFEGCGKPYQCRGYCYGHYDQLQRGIALRPLHSYGGGKCSIADCPEPLRSLGWCEFHYGRARRYGDPLATPKPRWIPGPCDFAGCTNQRRTRQRLCQSHADQRRRGEALRELYRPRKYAIDHHFFDVIDTEEKAYWLGFITADGCISKTSILTINLKAGDAGHLGKLGVALSSDYPVRPTSLSNPGTAGMVRWSGNSVPLVRALGALGVTPRKSATAVPWDGPPDLMRHFWRGMVDGDGGMSPSPGRNSSSPSKWCIYLTGSQPCVRAFGRWASDICGSRAEPRLNGHSKICWQWITGGNQMTSLLVRELYGGCTVSLDRKQVLADAILGMVPRR